MSIDTFEEMRLMARGSFRGIAFGLDSEFPDDAAFCKWQMLCDDHVGGFCNTNSYLELLDEILSEATWCDELNLSELTTNNTAAEQLFRFYAMVFLVVGQIFDDIRLIGRVAKSGNKYRLSPETGKLKGFINEVWKHRDGSSDKDGLVFHRDIHHGQLRFADDPTDSGKDVNLLSINNLDVAPTELDGIFVPSLLDGIRIIGDEIGRVGELLDDDEIRQCVEQEWKLREEAA